MLTRVVAEEAASFFVNLYGDSWPGQVMLEVMEIKLTEKGKVFSKVKKSFGFSTIQMFVDYFQPELVNVLQELGYHFFFTVCPTDFTETRKKENVVGIPALWADVDYVNEEEMKSRLACCAIPPTGIIASGGGYHLYWKLDRIYEPGPDVAEALKRVRGWVGGDSTQDITRLLRVPGTWNYGLHKGYKEPRKCEVKSWLATARYQLEEFLNARLAFGEIRLKDDFKNRYIKDGLCFNPENPDRSERDFAVIKELCRAGHTDEEIIDIFSNPEFACSSKVLEKDGNGLKYLQLTIAKSRAEVGSNLSAVYDDGEKIIRKKTHNNGMITEEIIGNFCVEILNHVNITSTETPFTELRIRSKGRVKEVAILPSAIISYHQFIEAVEFAGIVFTGSDTDWRQYQMYLFSKEVPQVHATDIVGWVGDSFVLANQTIIGDYVRYVNTGLTPPKVTIVKEEMDLDNFFSTIEPLLWDLRPQVAFPMFGWTLASIFAPRVRAMFPPGYFPHICMDGPPGSGKTTMAVLFPEMLYGLDNVHSFADSPASFRRALAGCNALPIVLDEYEDSRRFKTIDEINQYIRLAFQGGGAQRFNMKLGNFGQSEEMKLVSPLCVTASYGLKDQAIVERSYVVRVPCLSPVKTNAERRKGEKALLALSGALPRGAFLPLWASVAPTWMDRIAGLLDASDGTRRQQMAFAVISSVLLELAEKYQWKLNLNHLLQFYNSNQEHISLETPQDTIDLILGRAIHLHKLVRDRDWYFDTGRGLPAKQLICIHVSTMFEEMIGTMIDMQLGYQVDRKWIQQQMFILNEEGKILDRQMQSTKLDRKNRRYTVIDLDHFPVTAEAVYAFKD